jgi:hypothetical protein
MIVMIILVHVIKLDEIKEKDKKFFNIRGLLGISDV